MEYKASWWDEETGKWVLEYEAEPEEKEELDSLEQETGKSISEIVETWMRWVAEHPEEGLRQMREWKEEIEMEEGSVQEDLPCTENF